MQRGDIIADRYELIEPMRTSWLASDQMDGQRCLLKPVADFVDPRVAEWLGMIWHTGLPRLLDRIPPVVTPPFDAYGERPAQPAGSLAAQRVGANGALAVQAAEADGSRATQAAEADGDFFVFEYRQGRTLCELASESHGRMEAERLLPLLCQTAGILAYLHHQGDQPILHLDLKPEHILLGDNGQVSLIDFGAARIGPPANPGDPARDILDQANEWDGEQGERIALTPSYAAPEQLAGKPGPTSDIFSFGLVMLHLLSGEPPDICRGGLIEQLLPEASPGLLHLLADCLKADPRKRLSNAGELQQALVAQYGTLAISGSADRLSSVEPAIHGPVAGKANQAGTDKDIQLVTTRDTRQAAENASSRRTAEDANNRQASHGGDWRAGVHLGRETTTASDPANRVAASLLCVWGGPEFGCELAGVMGERQDILVIDADPFNPQADLLLGCDESRHVRGEFSPGSLDQALASEQRQELDTHRLASLAEKTRVTGVRLLQTGLSLEHYDYLSLDSLNTIMRLATLICDHVVVLCSSFVFDAFACLGLMKADSVMIPRPGEGGSLRSCGRSLNLLTARYKLDPGKLHFIAFSYRPDHDLGRGTLDELCAGRLIGCVSESARRRGMKAGAQPYAAALDRLNINEYRTIIRRLHIDRRRPDVSLAASGKLGED
jgi:hypothetical protein